MAVKTRFRKEELSQMIDLYDVGSFEDATDIAEGSVQTNMIVRTSCGKYVLKFYETRSCEYVNFECELVQFLNRNEYPCPSYLPSKRGEFTSMYRGKPFVLSTFEKGEKVEDPTWVQERQLVRAVARLNFISQDFRSDYTVYRWNYKPSLCVRLAERKAKSAASGGAKEKLDWIKEEADALDWCRIRE